MSARDEPEPLEIEDAESIRIRAARATVVPGDGRADESIEWDFERIEIDFEDIALHGVELRVYANPPRVALAPALCNLVVDRHVRIEVRPEATTHARWNAGEHLLHAPQVRFALPLVR